MQRFSIYSASQCRDSYLDNRTTSLHAYPQHQLKGRFNRSCTHTKLTKSSNLSQLLSGKVPDSKCTSLPLHRVHSAPSTLIPTCPKKHTHHLRTTISNPPLYPFFETPNQAPSPSPHNRTQPRGYNHNFGPISPNGHYCASKHNVTPYIFIDLVEQA